MKEHISNPYKPEFVPGALSFSDGIDDPMSMVVKVRADEHEAMILIDDIISRLVDFPEDDLIEFIRIIIEKRYNIYAKEHSSNDFLIHLIKLLNKLCVEHQRESIIESLEDESTSNG